MKVTICDICKTRVSKVFKVKTPSGKKLDICSRCLTVGRNKGRFVYRIVVYSERAKGIEDVYLEDSENNINDLLENIKETYDKKDISYYIEIEKYQQIKGKK